MELPFCVLLVTVLSSWHMSSPPALCAALPRYQARIPNAGDRSKMFMSNVPAPFGQFGVFCESVGHIGNCGGSPSYGGNMFGQLFHSSGAEWNETVCNIDSDGDGLTNAEELGDPMCVFTEGSVPPFVNNISHPGYRCSVPTDPFCLADPAPTGNPVTVTTPMSGANQPVMAATPSLLLRGLLAVAPVVISGLL